MISADEEKGMLVFSPTSQSKPSWQQDCRDQVSQYMANSLTTEDIHVPKEVAAQAVSIAIKLQKQNPGLTVMPNSDGTIITVAGKTSSVNLAKEAIDSLCSTITDSASVLLALEDFDYFQQVKKYDLPSGIACKFEPSTFTVVLRGPIGAVTKLKDSIGDFLQHADSPVMLGPLVTEFFKTEAGRGKLEKFLQERQCHAALHFSQYPNLTLHLLCDRTNANHVKAVVSQIHLHVTTQAIPIPEAVVPIISDLEDFIQLCQTVEHEHGVLIKHVGHEVSAAGFKAEVTSSLTEISKFLKEKASPLPPSEMKVSTLVGRSLQKGPQGVQKCLQPFHVQFNIDKHRGMLQFTPLHYLKPGWEEDCKSSVSEYIQSHIAEVKIQVPEKAYSDIMTVLYSSEQEDSTFVYLYPPQGTSLAFAGNTNAVKSTEDRMAQICADYSFRSEEVVLKPEDFEFLSQLKMQELVSKSHSVEIEPIHETHTLVLCGTTKGLKAAKEHIAILIAHATVAVELDQPIVEFFASEKGKERLFSLLREKRCDKCATYISESPMRLLLLCAQKHKHGVEKVQRILRESTSMALLQIPDLLVPFLPDLPEFLKEVTKLEKQNHANITIQGKQIVVAGFQDAVSQATDALSAFVKEKMTHFQPVQPVDAMKVSLPSPSEMKVSILVGRSLQKGPQGVQKCLQPFHVQFNIDKHRGMLQFTPLHYLKPGWEEACKSSVSEYIQSHIAEVKIQVPEKAYSDIMTVLYSSEQEDSTFVYLYPPQGTSLAFAGNTNAVKSTEDRMAQICADYSFRSEEVVLKPEDFEFLSQLKMQELVSKSHSVEIEPIHETHTLVLCGTTKGLKAAKEHIAILIAHATVAVELDQPIVEFFASEKGKERLFSLLREKRCDKCATYISESPMRLLLLCAQKHKHGVEKVQRILRESTSMALLQIPDLLVPFLPDLPEFLKEVTKLEKQNHANITIQGKQIVVAGFQDAVSQATDALSAFVKEKMTHFQPVQPVDAMKVSLPSPSEMKVSILVGRSLQKGPQGVQKCLQPFHVQFNIDKHRGMLQFTPLHYLKPGWEEDCKSSVSEYIQSHIAEVKIQVPEKAYSDIMTALYSSEQEDSTFVYLYPPQGTSLAFAGNTNAVKSTEDRMAQICADYSFRSEEVVLKPEDFEFLSQLKMQELVSKSHSVEIEPIHETHTLVLCGTTKGLKAAKEHIAILIAHATVAVELDQPIVEFFASEKGKERLFSLLREKRCDKCATYISESPMRLLLLCAQKHKHGVEKVQRILRESTSMALLQIPDLLVPFLPDLPEFLKEVTKLEKQNHANITIQGKQIVVAGFQDAVSQATDALSAFVKEKMTHFQPVQPVDAMKVSLPSPSEMKVSILVGRSLQKGPQGVQKCLQPFHVQFNIDKHRGMLQFTPLHYLKPGWEEACKSSVSEYIQSHIAEVKIQVPEKAYSDIMTVLYSSEQEDSTFVYLYPPQGTSLAFAGNTNAVKSTEDRMAQICADYSFRSEEVVLKPEDFEFLSQLKMQELVSKSHSVEIEPIHETHTLVLCGTTKGLKAAKEHIAILIAHATVAVELDQPIVEFFASEKGKERLFSLLREKRCDKCATYISESPMRLLLLCAQKHKHGVEKVQRILRESTSMALLQIPDLLVPFLPDLPEFLKEVTKLEKQNHANITIQGKQIVVAGFQDAVSQATDALSAFVKEKMTHFQPVQPVDAMKVSLPSPSEMKVSILMGRSLQKGPQGVQKCLQSFHVQFNIDKHRGMLQFTPLHYLKPGWEEDCKSSVSKYIQSHIAEVKIQVPEKAYSEVMAVLYSSEQEDSTFVYLYPPQGTSLAFAGNTNAVKSTEDRMAQICADYSFRSEEVVLKPEDFEFLSQLKMQELISKSRSVEIEPIHKTHTLVLSGTTKGLKAAKEHIATLTAHATVAVELDQPIVEFLASEKGKEKLFSLLREKRCDKCATYISESPMRLLLLCAQKHKHGVEKVQRILRESTSMAPLQIPDLLVPFLPDLPEFLKEVTKLEKQNHAKITVQGKQIVVAGFQDAVSQATDALSAFVKEKVIHFQPVQIPVDPMIAKCMNADLTGLEACMSSIHVNCTLKTDKTTASVSISPTKTSVSGWKEECKSLLASYIDEKYLREKIEIPKSVIHNVSQILVKTQKQSNFHFELHDDGSHAVVAGVGNVVQAAQAQISHICSKEKTSEGRWITGLPTSARPAKVGWGRVRGRPISPQPRSPGVSCSVPAPVPLVQSPGRYILHILGSGIG